MDNEPGFDDGQQPYPRQPRASGPHRRRMPTGVKVALGVAGVLVAGGALVGLGYGVLYAFNPMGDEWQCSEDEAPAGADGFYNHCFAKDATLPRGYEWDPFGNRPMPYNCDKTGWVQIHRNVVRDGLTEVEEDCVREGTDLPAPWHVAKDG